METYNTDSYIEIGNSHNICEDYAIDGTFFHLSIGEKVPYIILCDGCSSSKKTDFGARILAHSCERALFNAYHRNLMEEFNENTTELRSHIKDLIIFNAMTAINSFGLPYDICDATLLYAYIFKNWIYVCAYGDGNIVFTWPKEGFVWINIQYESNAPLYLSYEMDALRKRSYFEDKEFGGKSVNIKTIHSADGNIYTKQKQEYKINPNEYIHECESANTFNGISLFSDGVETYQYKTKKEFISPEEHKIITPFSMIQRMVAYKNHNGEFVKRRMKKIKQECEKSQAEHFDDVSSTTIWINNA